MKIYIVGSVGSGKTTLAKQISAITNIPCHHLDEIVYVEDPTDSWGNKKRPIVERDKLFNSVLINEHYIMEDAGRDYFMEGMYQADTVILLDIHPFIRRKRILLRWLKQKLGYEKCIYKPQLVMLKAMFKWARNYDVGADGTKSRVAKFQTKLLTLRNNREIFKYLEYLKNSSNTAV